MTNPLIQTDGLIFGDQQDQLWRGVVTAVDGDQLSVRRDGSIVSEGPYSTLEGITAIAGDEVAVARIGSDYVVLGRIVRNTLPARPLIPLALAEVTNQSTTSASLTDIPGLTTTLTLYRPMKLFAVMSFEANLSAGAASVLGVALNIHGTDHQEHDQTLSVNGTMEIGAIVHSDVEMPAGTYIVKGRFRRVSGPGTVTLDFASLVAMGLPS